MWLRNSKDLTDAFRDICEWPRNMGGDTSWQPTGNHESVSLQVVASGFTHCEICHQSCSHTGVKTGICYQTDSPDHMSADSRQLLAHRWWKSWIQSGNKVENIHHWSKSWNLLLQPPFYKSSICKPWPKVNTANCLRLTVRKRVRLKPKNPGAVRGLVRLTIWWRIFKHRECSKQLIRLIKHLEFFVVYAFYVISTNSLVEGKK